MKRVWLHLTISLCLTIPFLASCSEEDNDGAPYPNTITEMADMYTDEHGTATQLVLDNEQTYRILNPKTGMSRESIYRVMAGFELFGKIARIHQLTGVYILRDSTLTAHRDPTKIVSVWRTSRYINLHVAPKTQGGEQHWGFITDSIVPSIKSDGTPLTDTEGNPILHAYLSLHHNQNGDPESYTEDVYLSLPIDSIKGITSQSPITINQITPSFHE